ncbi:MAG: DUF1788 domain-containing protein [Aquabacterium sp.]|jgi:hypothetical protein|uniref:DUF1788 domain-containing protein n=1 Tax=Aquabacterium sp. TaxID=1872578 RepID=UPI002721E397|nr:DUF1788 domain-containing protein [Aquabacterium sp.]MDO9001863.1 DUF1788 domain-containing protein [Aquabacterium sp.]
MSLSLDDRLNRIIGRITSEEFLQNQGLGNEIGFWIFDYPPDKELDVRAFIDGSVLPTLAKRVPAIRVQNINLFELVIDLLKERGLLDQVLQMQVDKGNDAVLAPLRSVLKEDKLARRIAEKIDLQDIDMLILTGVGAAYPMLRTNTLLSALHPVMQDTPLLMFYPGRYDGYSLNLFSKLADDHYYRAFRLVD